MRTSRIVNTSSGYKPLKCEWGWILDTGYWTCLRCHSGRQVLDACALGFGIWDLTATLTDTAARAS